MTADKACKIVKDGAANGRKLSKAQRGMFGARCGTRGAVANAGQPRHQESGQWLHGGLSPATKQFETAARRGAQHVTGHEQPPAEDPSDDGDFHPDIGQGDRPPERLALDTTGRATGRKVTNMYHDPVRNFNACHDAMGLFCHAGSQGAANASRMATHSGKASDHKRAATEHTKAAAHHREEGNEDVAQMHEAAAKHHARAARGTTRNLYHDPGSPITRNHEVPMTLSRTDALGVLTANCACEADAAALNALGDDTLAHLAANVLLANEADAVGKPGSSDQAGGEEDEKPDGDEDFDDAMTQVKRKTPKNVVGNALTPDQFWAAAPPGFREQFEEGQLALNERKLEVVQKLVANVADKGRRHALGNKLLALPLSDLRERLELLPAPAVNARPAGPNFGGIGTGGIGTPYAGGPTHPHFQPQLFRDPRPAANYLGAGAPGAGPQGMVDNAADEGLPLPTIDWGEVAREQRQERHTA